MGAAPERRTRAAARVDELPSDARALIDALLEGGKSAYGHISDALGDRGYAVSKAAIGRYHARKKDDLREADALVRQTGELVRLNRRGANLDAAGQALAVLIERLSARMAADPGMFEAFSAERAASGIVQAVRALGQYEKLMDDRKKKKAEARAEILCELREALKGERDILERILALVQGDAPGAGD
jgi:ribosomal protein S21